MKASQLEHLEKTSMTHPYYTRPQSARSALALVLIPIFLGDAIKWFNSPCNHEKLAQTLLSSVLRAVGNPSHFMCSIF